MVKIPDKEISGMKKTIMLLCVLLALVTLTGVASAAGRTYTLNADFDEGTLLGVEHTTVPDQLQLSTSTTTFPFIWVPNTGQGTVSKIDTVTGKEIGRYRISGYGDPSPSRTTVDLQGNAFVGMRQAGTVVKIGLDENGACIDRNHNGVIDTSRDLDNNGDITGAELFPWGQDECVLYEVVLIEGKQGTFVPGAYTGGYDTNYWGTSPRGLAIDSSNNVWAGTWSSQKFYHINGATGAIIGAPVPFGAYSGYCYSYGNCGSYGAVIDQSGILWSSTLYGPVVKLNTNTLALSNLPIGHLTYGIGLDNLNQVFVNGWTDNVFSRIDASTGTKDWTKGGTNGGRGIAATSDNNIWTANTYGNDVRRFTNDGNLIATIGFFSQPTGIAVDAAGKVWATDLGDENIKRINPATNSIDLTKAVVGSGGHYTYSDMTGSVVRSITTKLGTWTVTYDSGAPGTLWGKISWNSLTPTGTQATVRARSSNDQLSWSSWETASNGGNLAATPAGKFIQVETTLQILSGQNSPVLYDLTVTPAGSIPSPEFPTPLIPVTALIGMLAFVLLVRMNRD
jgi:large repetitive protein